MLSKNCGLIVSLVLLVSAPSIAQRVGIGTTNPLARLAIDSGLMIDQADINNGTLSAGALVFGSEAKVGISRSTVPGSSRRNGLGIYTNSLLRVLVDSLGRVGINTAFPSHQLSIAGNMYLTGNIGIGTVTDPQYDLHLSGSARIGSFLGINIDPSSSYRLAVNGDAYFQGSNIGINIAPSSSYSLYAAGSVRLTGDVRIDGELNPNNALTIGNNTSIAGSLTVGGRGIVRGSGSAQWRLVRIQVGYSGGVGANSDVVGAALAYNLSGGNIAGILVGPIVQAGSGSSNLESLGLVPTNISNTGCRFLIINGSNLAADMGSNTTPTIWQLTLLVFD